MGIFYGSRKVTPYSLIREEINWKEQFSFNKGVVFLWIEVQGYYGICRFIGGSIEAMILWGSTSLRLSISFC